MDVVLIKLQRLKAIIMKGVSETVEQADLVAVKMVEQKQEDLMGRVVCWIVQGNALGAAQIATPQQEVQMVKVALVTVPSPCMVVVMMEQQAPVGQTELAVLLTA